MKNWACILFVYNVSDKLIRVENAANEKHVYIIYNEKSNSRLTDVHIIIPIKNCK